MGRFNTSIKDRELRQVNTINSEVRIKLQDLLEDLIDSLDLNELDTNQRIKMLQIALQYTLPKLKEEVDEVKDLPLFIN
jgi:hypothetical protein